MHQEQVQPAGDWLAEADRLYNVVVDFVAEWWGLALLVAIVLAVWRFARNRVGAVIPERRRDPRRLFTSADRRWIYSNMRGGARCEHRMFFGLFRCKSRRKLQLDHWWPHARGGATSRDNLALLCAKHNGAKSHKTPHLLQTEALNFARRGYMKKYPGRIGGRYRRGMIR